MNCEDAWPPIVFGTGTGPGRDPVSSGLGGAAIACRIRFPAQGSAQTNPILHMPIGSEGAGLQAHPAST